MNDTPRASHADVTAWLAGAAERALPGPPQVDTPEALLARVENVPLDVIAERVIAEFLRDWDAGGGAFDYRHAGRALICRLADAGAIVTPDADGSEHPGAHALRAAALEVRRIRETEGATGPYADHFEAWLRARADQLEAGDG